MSDETTEAIPSHDDGKPPVPDSPSTWEMIPTVSNSVHLAIPTKDVLPKTLSLGPPETWVPYYIHTAKCDRCGQHNTSVIQRSSRENKQFCKACMHLNVRDGLYSVNVAGLDWNPRTSSAKRRTRGIGKLRKPQKLKKFLKSSVTTRISKSIRREPRTKAKILAGFTERSDPENRTDTQIVPMDGTSEEEDETDDDFGFGRLPHSDLLSSDGQAMCTTTTNDRVESMLSAANTEEMEPGLESGRKMEKELSQCVSGRNAHIQWWERIRISESNARDENIHTNFMEQQDPEVSVDVIEAAKILIKMRKG